MRTRLLGMMKGFLIIAKCRFCLLFIVYCLFVLMKKRSCYVCTSWKQKKGKGLGAGDLALGRLGSEGSWSMGV